MGTPTFTGSEPGAPVMLISPLMPCATRSKPPRRLYGPVPPNPDMLQYTSPGFSLRASS